MIQAKGLKVLFLILFQISFDFTNVLRVPVNGPWPRPGKDPRRLRLSLIDVVVLAIPGGVINQPTTTLRDWEEPRERPVRHLTASDEPQDGRSNMKEDSAAYAEEAYIQRQQTHGITNS